MPERANPVLARVFRGDLVESLHRGAYAVVRDGRLVRSRGDVRASVFLRSAAKPFQAIAALAGGVAERFSLAPEEIAILAGSHSGEAAHVRAVRSLLRKGGLRAADLRCGTHEPFDAKAAAALRRRGTEPDVRHNNCSGKHAGMLLLARALGAPTGGYLDPAHPVQRAILRSLAAFSGIDAARIAIAVDGCSAPTFAIPLVALARAFERLVAPGTGVPSDLARAAKRLRAAVAAHPLQIAGSGRVCTELVTAAPRDLFPKSGAEGVYAIGVGGRGKGAAGIAIKVDDGAARGYRPLLPALIESTRLLPLATLARVRRRAVKKSDTIVFNHARAAVGRVEARP